VWKDLTFLCKRTDSAKDLPLPARQSAGAAGMDLYANVAADVCIKPGARALIPTGFCVALPEGYEAQVRPRSGLAFRFGVTILNGVGTIDADYRGELQVLLINLGQADYTITRGARVAQLVIARVAQGEWEEADTLPDSVRGDGGYGSTGT